MSQNVVNSYRYGGCPACTDCESETTGGSGSGGWGVYGNADLGVGMIINAGHVLVGKEILNVTFWLYNNGVSLTANTYAHLWEGNGNPAASAPHTRASARATSDAVEMSEIGESFTAIKYIFSSPATLQAGDYMSADIDETGAGVNWASDGSAYETNTTGYEFRSTSGGWLVKTFGNRFRVEYTC